MAKIDLDRLLGLRFGSQLSTRVAGARELLADGDIEVRVVLGDHRGARAFIVECWTKTLGFGALNPKRDDARIGWVDVRYTTDRDLGRECSVEIEMMRAEYRNLLKPQADLMIVVGSGVDKPWRRRGIGALMYAEAVREAGRRGAMLLAHACEITGDTSEAAVALWESGALMEQPGSEIVVSGLVAFAPARILGLRSGSRLKTGLKPTPEGHPRDGSWVERLNDTQVRLHIPREGTWGTKEVRKLLKLEGLAEDHSDVIHNWPVIHFDDDSQFELILFNGRGPYLQGTFYDSDGNEGASDTPDDISAEFSFDKYYVDVVEDV